MKRADRLSRLLNDYARKGRVSAEELRLIIKEKLNINIQKSALRKRLKSASNG